MVAVSHTGYWYNLDEKMRVFPYEPNTEFMSCRQPFGTFRSNTVHSTGLYGLRIHPTYNPTMSGLNSDNEASPATFHGFVSWGNMEGFHMRMSTTVQLKNALVFDNTYAGIIYESINDKFCGNPVLLRPTFYNIQRGSSIQDTIIIGTTNQFTSEIIPSNAGIIGIVLQTFISFFS